MIEVYDAANSIEAHLIKNMLEQANIHAYIHGASLQGGIGDLPAFGLVKVLVNENDYDQAKEIIDNWFNAEPIPENRKF